MSRGKCLTGIATLLLLVALGGCQPETTAQQHLTQAQEYQRQGDLKAAVVELKNALQKEPTNGEARWQIAEIYLQQGDSKGAVKEFSQARQMGFAAPQLARNMVEALLLAGHFEKALEEIGQLPPSEGVQTLLFTGRAQLGLGNEASARQAFQQALEAKPEAVEARLGLARVAFAENDLAEALIQIEAVLQTEPRHLQALLMKGEIALIQNRPEDAGVAFAEVLQGPEKDNVLAHLGMARIALAQGERDLALQHIETVQRRFPAHPIANYLLAVVKFQDRDLQAAKNTLRQVLQLDPEHLPSLLLMGNLHLAEGHLEQAQEALQRYSQREPHHLLSRKLLGMVLLGRQQPAQAIEALLSVLDQGREDVQFLALLGTAYMRAGDAFKAADYLGQASHLAPDAAVLRSQLAVNHLLMGETGQAVTELQSAIALDQEFFQADVLLTLVHLRNKAYDEALTAATKLIDKQPGNPFFQNLVAGALLNKGEVSKARQHLEEALRLQPDFLPAVFNLALLDLKEGQVEAARQRYAGILKANEHQPEALMALARLENAEGRLQEAVELLEQARHYNPQALLPRLILGQHYVQQGRTVAKAHEIAAEAYTIAPQEPSVLRLLGTTQMGTGRHAEASATYQKLVTLEPQSPAFHTQLGLAQMGLGNLAEARDSFTKALELSGGQNNPSALEGLASIHLASGRLKEAKDAIEAFRKTYPDLPAASTLQGDLAVKTGNFLEAVRFYEQAREKGENTRLTINLNYAYRQAGKPAEGLVILQKWLADHPEDNPVRLILANAYEADKQYADAAGEYVAILQTQPEHPVALNNLAWIYHRQGNPKALELAELAHRLAQDNPHIMDTLGWLQVETGQVQQGLRLLERAAAALPEKPEIRYHLAVALWRAKNHADARTQLETLLASETPFPEREHARSILQMLP